jgi:cytochrome c553
MKTLLRTIAALGLVLLAWLWRGRESRAEVIRAPIIRMAVTHPWLVSGALAAAALIVGAIVVISGIAPINASSGHWDITSAFLDFAKTRSVSTHSWGIKAPRLDDEALVLRGAGHYEQVCVACHGAPGRTPPPAMAAMTPPPPGLIPRLSRWTPEELFTIVKHGIKFTGMPAWPVQQRDDEVWAMVAFLRRMPTLDPSGYRRVVSGDAGDVSGRLENSRAPISGAQSRPEAVRNVCHRCHGPDGTGRGLGAFPSLAGQRAEYLRASLRAFANRERLSGTMEVVAASLSDAERRAAADYYAGLRPREPERTAGDDDSAIARGAAIASYGIPDRDIPACAECHGPTHRPKNPEYPRLAGQHPRYLAEQLQQLKEGRRGGSPNVALMRVFVDRLRPEDIRDVTRYYGSAAPVVSAEVQRQQGGLASTALPRRH